MAVFPQDKRGQLELVFTILAIGVLYFVWSGTPIGGFKGVSGHTVTRDSMVKVRDSIQRDVDRAKRVVRRGAVRQVERQLAEYRASLDMMRQLVPSGTEMPNLFDDITSRAKVRGANVVNIAPAPLESSAPFDIQRARVQAVGTYDQLGEYLADIASLPRIIVPYDVRISRITSPTADTALTRRNLLVATFQIKTFVKPVVEQPTRPPAAAAPAPAPGGGGGT